MFIQTQQTPNPNSLKFVTQKKVSLVGPVEFKDKNETSISLIKNILSINGVTGIFLSDDYLSVNKDTNSERVGKFNIESAKYSYAAKLVVKRLAIFGNNPFR